MSIGYACLTVGVPGTGFKNCLQKNAGGDKLYELISYNLSILDKIIDYNIKNDVRLFRISSGIIPFGSSPVNNLNWQDIFRMRLIETGNKIRSSGMRVSMHPGQYTILNSPDTNIVKKAVDDLEYHTNFLDSLDVGRQNKIILHIGGIYGNKTQATKRFADNFYRLDETIKRRLVIENDDKCYTVADVLKIADSLDLPVIFDNLHHLLNPSGLDGNDGYWINLCRNTWRNEDGRQKLHYSQNNPHKKNGAHSDSILINEFLVYYDNLVSKDIDIMLEVKDKNLSAIKCINCLTQDRRISRLEYEWSRYKYLVMEKSHQDYNKISILLKDKNSYPAIDFYSIIENVISKPSVKGDAINAAMHVWGYFKEKASEKEKALFLNKTQSYLQGKTSLAAVKNNLLNLAVKYREEYLLNSYYFSY